MDKDKNGNGRITGAITDMLLARSDSIPQRFYSMSAQIRLERKTYYNVLEKSQKGGALEEKSVLCGHRVKTLVHTRE